MPERKIISIKDLGLEIPEYTFHPNIWTETFLTGLSTISVQNAKIAELGVGTGVIGIDFIQRGAHHYVGLDIDERILPVAYRNITKAITKRNVHLTLLVSDLLASLAEDHSFDLICGCLPQVSKPNNVTLGNADSYARYFDSEKYQSDLNIYGLGLNENALIQAKTRLKSDGKVILVLSGRSGIFVINQMFEKNGYTPKIIFEDTIPQLRETTLTTLVEYENQGKEFFFYEDHTAQNRISVAEAEQRRLKGIDSYHKLYVVEGTQNPLEG